MADRKRLNITLAVCLAVLIFAAGGGVLFAFVIWPQIEKLPFMPNNEVVDFHTHFSLDPEITGLVVDDRRSHYTPLVENDVVYLPVSYIRDNIDPFIFWDEYARLLFITTHDDVLQFMPNALTYLINNNAKELKNPILYRNGEAYITAGMFGNLYPYHIVFKPEYNLVILDSRDVKITRAGPVKKTEMRYRPDIKAPVCVSLTKDDYFFIYEEDGDFTRIRTEDGLLGYILTDNIGEKIINPPMETLEKEKILNSVINNYILHPPDWPAGEKINLVWEAAYNMDALGERMKNPIHASVNVISPTWYTLNAENKSIDAIGSQEYVNWALNQSVKVWPMLSDENYDTSRVFLTDASLRKWVVNNIASLTDEYKLDGINIDFEHVREADGPYFIQFLRELAPVLRARGVVLSVDVYVPSPWHHYYRPDLIALTADFLCVMTYDEHYQRGPSSGPVASLPFVEKGVSDMLALAPKEKIIMGLPYYNRIWREVVNNDSPETRQVQHFGMERAKALLAENNADVVWDPVIGSYYGDYAVIEEGETVQYRLWLEDENSIAEKLKIYRANDLAGIAGWRRGFENDAVWELLGTYFN